MKNASPNKAKSTTESIKSARAEMLRESMRKCFQAYEPKLTAITAAERAGLKKDALRNFIDRESMEPGVFKVADVAAILGTSVDELLATGNHLRDTKFPDIFLNVPPTMVGSAKGGGATHGGEGMKVDSALQFINENWSVLSEPQRLELLRKMIDFVRIDEARFLKG